MKPTVQRGLLLDFLKDIVICEGVHPARIHQVNDKSLEVGSVVYVMSRELRINDNWGFIFAYNLAKKENKEFKVLIYLDEKICSLNQEEFRAQGLKFLENDLKKNGVEFEIVKEKIESHLQRAGVCVVDFNPISFPLDSLKVPCRVYEVDSHNIIPARYISDKQEFAAATLRRKVYANIAEFLTEYDNIFAPNFTQADSVLSDFIQDKLNNYSTDKNDPNKQAVSGLSSYMHFGFISSQRVAIEVLKSDATRENKEAFLEELIVRKELSDNFCLYNPNFKNPNAAPSWAKESLEEHRLDVRNYIYSLEEFEAGKTHDNLWNAAQIKLVNTGKMHGYLRMYWAKKILEWSVDYQGALRIAIYLNDTYALDGNDPNGYVGIMWSILGLHDRAFFPRPVFGKIRYMSYEGCKKKFDTSRYINSIN